MTKRSVLIVDDDPAIQLALVRVFQRRGWAAAGCGDVASAVEALAKEMPDIVLLDKDLPDGTGIDIARTLRRNGHTVPVVIITAYASLQSAVESMELQIAAYLTKPFSNIFDVVKRSEEIVVRQEQREEMRRLRRQARKRPDLKHLIVSHDWDSLGRLAVELGRSATVETLSEVAEIGDHLREGSQLIILLDLSVGQSVLLETLKQLRGASTQPEPILVVVGDVPSTELITQLISAGAHTFISRSIDGEALRLRLERLTVRQSTS